MWQFNELRKQINKQNQYFTKEIGTLKNSQTEILEIKTSVKGIKNGLYDIENKADQVEERISDIECRHLEMMQREEET